MRKMTLFVASSSASSRRISSSTELRFVHLCLNVMHQSEALAYETVLQIVIKKRGNVTYVTGFMHCTRRLEIRKIYWMFGFAEEFLSHLMKQPVKLEFQFVADEKELAYNWI